MVRHIVRDRVRRILWGLVAVTAMAVVPATALAHGPGSHGARGIALLPITVFGAGMLVLATGLYLGTRDDTEAIYANAGIAIGVAGVLAALALFLF